MNRLVAGMVLLLAGSEALQARSITVEKGGIEISRGKSNRRETSS